MFQNVDNLVLKFTRLIDQKINQTLKNIRKPTF